MTLDDLPQVMAIEEVSFPTPWTAGLFIEEMGYPFCCDLVAYTGDALVGYISFAVILDEIHLRNIAVHPRRRRSGIATALMRVLMETGIRKRTKRVTMEARPSNAAALALYKKFGFVVEGIRPDYYGDTGEDALILWADIVKMSAIISEAERANA